MFNKCTLQSAVTEQYALPLRMPLAAQRSIDHTCQLRFILLRHLSIGNERRRETECYGAGTETPRKISEEILREVNDTTDETAPKDARCDFSHPTSNSNENIEETDLSQTISRFVISTVESMKGNAERCCRIIDEIRGMCIFCFQATINGMIQCLEKCLCLDVVFNKASLKEDVRLCRRDFLIAR